MRVAVIDYGMGNLYSVRNSFSSLGIKTDILASSKGLLSYDKLILPGVGAFGDAMRELRKRGFPEPIKEFVVSGRPFLGICLGMQLLMDSSEEAKGGRGLGIIPGKVKKFTSKLKCPHMGWNRIARRGRNPDIFKGLGRDIYAYFCHSYYVAPQDPSRVIGETEYGIRFASMIRQGNVYGMQFHPEKSQETGLRLLQNFIARC